jgi:hypothetical protein
MRTMRVLRTLTWRRRKRARKRDQMHEHNTRMT